MRNAQSTLIHKWFDEVWNKGNEDAIGQLMTKDTRAHGIVAPDQPGGAEGFKLFYNDFKNQFHDIKVDVEDVVSQDDVESARTTVHARHTASNKPVTFTGMCMARIEGGQIAEAWNNYDFLGMYQQLGHKITPAE